MRKMLIVLAVLTILSAGIPLQAESGIIAPLVVLPSTDIQIPSGTEIREYSAPMILGNIFLMAKTQTPIFSRATPLCKSLSLQIPQEMLQHTPIPMCWQAEEVNAEYSMATV